jgi:hypothetical protein
MYQETLDEIREVKTIASHITGFGKILNTTEDPTLQQLIDRVIKMLQKLHADPTAKGKSTSQSLQAVRSTSLRALIEYCSNHTKAKKPEWQVLAEKNGWAPKT